MLARMCEERHESYAALSRMLGRNAAYIHQFITRGTPVRLDECDRKMLADYFGVDESVLGGPTRASTEMIVTKVPVLGVSASAGPGALVDGETVIGRYGFDRAWLKRTCRARPEDLSIVTVSGDSMAPTLVDGDDVLVDTATAGVPMRDGIYVLRRDDTLMVKRLSLSPTIGTMTITSDNPAYPSWSNCPLDSIAVLGRVVWAGRKFS